MKQVKKRFTLDFDNVFNIFNTILMLILFVVFFWPMWFVLIASISDPNQVWLGQVLLWPKGLTFDAYQAVLDYQPIWTGYRNALFYTAVGTTINVVMTILCAYPLSRKDLAFRRPLMLFFIITMYFGGGLVPTYLVINDLGMMDTIWAILIPGCLSVYNMLIVRNYLMNSLPAGLFEAAEIDGAGPARYLVSIALPLSTPVLAVVGLYYGVGHWNSYFGAMIYLNDPDLYPLQLVLKELLTNAQNIQNMSAQDGMDALAQSQRAELMKYSTIVVAMVPVLIAYPFIQKYFAKGIMIGSMKG